jgi:hypothetical protein
MFTVYDSESIHVFCSVRNQTQGLVHTMQILYHWARFPEKAHVFAV